MPRKNRKSKHTPLNDHGLDPYGCASPSRPPLLVLYFHRDPDRRMVLNWGSYWGAKKALGLLGIHDRKSFNESPIDIDDRMDGEELEKVLDYTLTKKEEEFGEVPTPDREMLLRFIDVEVANEDNPLPKTKRTSVKPKKSPKERKPKANREGLITIAQIAEDLSMEPRDARKILRAKKVSKPEAGWCWPEDEVAGIKETLSG